MMPSGRCCGRAPSTAGTRIWGPAPVRKADKCWAKEGRSIRRYPAATREISPFILLFQGNREGVREHDDVSPPLNAIAVNPVVADYRADASRRDTPSFRSTIADAHAILRGGIGRHVVSHGATPDRSTRQDFTSSKIFLATLPAVMAVGQPE